MKNVVTSYVLTGIGWLTAAIQDNPVAQWITFAISIVASVASVAFTIVKFAAWVKDALKDGKITEEELEEGEKILDELKGANDEEDGNGDGDQGTSGQD